MGAGAVLIINKAYKTGTVFKVINVVKAFTPMISPIKTPLIITAIDLD